MHKKIKNIFNSVDGSIEIIGTKRIIVEDMKSILEYCGDRVRLDIGDNMLVVSGTNLKIYDYYNKNLIIDGKISAVTFE